MKRLRIAVAGAGAIGRRHVELVLAGRNCDLAAIVDPSSSASEIARKAGVPLFSSLTDLFAHERPDGAGRVKRKDGSLLPNLFAAGGAAAGVSGSTAAGYLSGNGLLTAAVLGRLAGQSAAAQVTHSRRLA